MVSRTVLVFVVLAVLSPTITLGKQLRMTQAVAGSGKTQKQHNAMKHSLLAKNKTAGKDAEGANASVTSPSTDDVVSNATNDASNATNDVATSANETEAPTADKAVNGCVTRKEPRASAWFAETSPPGTPCVFGADERDEGAHCIQEQDYGSFGWCFTKSDRSAWGSCDEGCPLSGHAKVLGKRIDRLTGTVSDLADTVQSKVVGAAGQVVANATKTKGVANAAKTKGVANAAKTKGGKGGKAGGKKKKKAGLAQAEPKKLGTTVVGKKKATTHAAAKKHMKNKQSTKPKAALAQASKPATKAGKTKMHAVAKKSKTNTNQKKSRASALGISSTRAKVKQQHHATQQHTEHQLKQRKPPQSSSNRAKHQLKQQKQPQHSTSHGEKHQSQQHAK